MQSHDFMTTSGAARLLEVSPDCVRYYERTGKLLAFRIEQQRVFIRQDVERFRRERDARILGKSETLGVLT